MGRMNPGGYGPAPGGRPGGRGPDIGSIAGRVAEHAMHHAIDNALGGRRHAAPPPPPPPHHHHHHHPAPPPPPPPPPRPLVPQAVDPIYYRHAYTALDGQLRGRGATPRDWEFIDYVFGVRLRPHEYHDALHILAEYCASYRV